jgi:formyl-CoA transferase
MKNRESLISLIEEKTAALTTQQVSAALNEAGVPCAPINDYGEVFSDDHLNAREFFWDSEHPTAGAVRQIGSPMRLSRTPSRRGPAGPMLGQHNDRLEGLGFSTEELAALTQTGQGDTSND